MVVLKRMEDAVRDGDRVYALIRGIGTSSDGREVSVMAPRLEGEELALRRAYEEAGVSPRSVGLVEAHGTATPVGDVVEIEALTRVFGERAGELPPCALGTVKSMISHTIPAAGVAGLIKTALALYQRVLPPTLGCDEPNPKLRLERTPFYINTETRPWIHGGPEPRRAGVNAFGFGGINAHAVLEEVEGAPALDHRPPWDSELCVLESDSPAGLADEAERLTAALGPNAAGRAHRRRVHARRRARENRTALAPCGRRNLGRGPAREARSGGRQAARSGLPRHQDQVRHLLRPRAARARRQGGVRLPRRGRAVHGHARRPLPPLLRGAPGFRADRPPLHRAPARTSPERLGVPTACVLGRGAAAHRGAIDAARHRGRVGAHRQRRDARGAQASRSERGCRGRDTARASTRQRWPPACSMSTPTSGCGRSARGCTTSYADAAARHDVPGAVLLAMGADRDRVSEIADEAGGELHLAMDNCPHQTVLVGEPEAARRARDDRGARRPRVRAAPVRPRGAHAAVRALRRGPACRVRRTAGAARQLGSVVLHHGRAVSRQRGRYAQAARRALDESGALPRHDRGALRRRRARVRGSGAARKHDRVRRGHPARAAVVRGGFGRPSPLGRDAAQPPGRAAGGERRGCGRSLPVRTAAGRGDRLAGGRRGQLRRQRHADPTFNELADAAHLGRGRRAAAPATAGAGGTLVERARTGRGRSGHAGSGQGGSGHRR